MWIIRVVVAVSVGVQLARPETEIIQEDFQPAPSETHEITLQSSADCRCRSTPSAACCHRPAQRAQCAQFCLTGQCPASGREVRRCPHCSRPLQARDVRQCPNCSRPLESVPQPRCPYCDHPLRPRGVSLCPCCACLCLPPAAVGGTSTLTRTARSATGASPLTRPSGTVPGSSAFTRTARSVPGISTGIFTRTSRSLQPSGARRPPQRSVRRRLGYPRSSLSGPPSSPLSPPLRRRRRRAIITQDGFSLLMETHLGPGAASSRDKRHLFRPASPGLGGDTDPCLRTFSCRNGGTCQRRPFGELGCRCLEGWTGRLCTHRSR